MWKLSKGLRMALAVAALGHVSSAGAYMINDTYWGGNTHGWGDRIGGPVFEVQGANVLRQGSTLLVDIFTSFAGHADEKQFASLTNTAPSKLNGKSMGIGYGDLFLGTAWTPFGSDPHHPLDKAENGTHWSYGFALGADRWTDNGGTGFLYALNGATNAANAFLSDDMLSGGTIRNGQEIVVKTASRTVTKLASDSGTWSVDQTPNLRHLHFAIDVAGTDLATSREIALHWAMSCGNDTIEGIHDVPEPGSMALALAALATRWHMRRIATIC